MLSVLTTKSKRFSALPLFDIADKSISNRFSI